MKVGNGGLVLCLYQTLSSALLGRNFELERMEALCSEVFRFPPPAFCAKLKIWCLRQI